MKLKMLISVVAIAGLIVSVSAGCGTKLASDPGNNTNGNSDEVRTLTIAASPGYRPITYTDESGNLDGYDVAVFKKIDELLPEYKFVFEAVDKETLNIGVETGKYQIGLNGLFRSPEREEKYLIPENQLGATRVGFVVREDETRIATWDDLVNVRVSPTTASGGIFGQLNFYNEAHPDNPIKFDIVSQTDRASSYGAVKSGDYDVAIELIDVYNQIDDPTLLDGVKITGTASKVATYPIINKSETELANKINSILGDLRADGTLSDLAKQHYGADVFAD